MVAHVEGVVIVRGDADAVPVPMVLGAGSAVALIWPGMGAQYRSMHRVALEKGASSIVLRHESDAVYYVVKGAAEFVDLDAGQATSCDAGSAVHIDAGTAYAFRAPSGASTVVGGACPADLRLYPAADSDIKSSGATGASTEGENDGNPARASG